MTVLAVRPFRVSFEGGTILTVAMDVDASLRASFYGFDLRQGGELLFRHDCHPGHEELGNGPYALRTSAEPLGRCLVGGLEPQARHVLLDGPRPELGKAAQILHLGGFVLRLLGCGLHPGVVVGIIRGEIDLDRVRGVRPPPPWPGRPGSR